MTPRIPVVVHGAAGGGDLLGRRWVQAVPAPGMTSVAIGSYEAEFLADAFRNEAARARDEGRLADAVKLAQRGLELREVAHAADPALSLASGSPRFPGMEGSA